MRAGNVAIKAVRLCHDFINRTGKPLSEEEYAAVNLFLNRLKGKVHGSYQARIEEQKTKLFQIYNARHEVSLMKKLDEIELEHVHFQQDLFKRLVKVQPALTAVLDSVRAYWGHLTDFGFLQRCLGWIRRIIWLREILEPLGFGGKSATAPEATVARHLLKGLAVLTKPCANRSKMF